MNRLLLALACFAAVDSFATADDWSRQELTSEFHSEGGTCGDVDKDGQIDVIAGPFVYYGPDFKQKSRMYDREPYDINGYSNNFLCYSHDVDGDGWLDVLIFDFPGAETWFLKNPGKGVREQSQWPKHTALKVTDNESPMFTDVTGDGKPEIVCCNGGHVGYAEIPADPTQPWTFTPVSENRGYQKFTHGLGVGDVNDDGRKDLMTFDGWWEQPTELDRSGDTTPWKHHAFKFADSAAQMYAVDLSGDGVTEVVTSLRAHGYGLAVYRKVGKSDGGEIRWEQQLIMTDKAETSPTQLAISQLHAIDLADFDNDGDADILTGKRYWAHNGNDPGAREPKMLVWFETKQGEDKSAQSLRFIPHIIDTDSGVGTQITACDINQDGHADVFSANKRGVHVFLRNAEPPTEPVASGSSKPVEGVVKIDDAIGGYRPADGARPLNLDFETGDLTDWTASGSAFAKQPVKGDAVAARRGDMKSDHTGEFWVGSYERAGDQAEGTLESRPFILAKPWVSFLLGGGKSSDIAAQIIDVQSGDVLLSTSGSDREDMKRAVLEMSNYQGRPIAIRLIDRGSEGWGHINFDDFRLHDSQPTLPAEERLLKHDEYAHDQLPGEKAAAAMTLPPGFKATLMAAEPDVKQPIAMTIDERGRIWIAEAYEYPRRAEGDRGRDRILIFEDTDQNGTLDSRKVFYEGLNLISGLEVGHGGVWVGAAPYLYFIADADRDDQPDGPPVVELDGFGWHDTHETLNSFIWGLDGWLYGCHGVFTHSKVGRPGTPDDQRQGLNAGIWRYHPTRKQFEVFAHGTSNPWGVDWDSRGQCFLTACVIPHLFHIIPNARYHRQAGNHFNPYTYDDIKTIAVHRHWIGNQWREGRDNSDAVGGGHAHSGAMIYQGGSWPKKYYDQILMNNIHGARWNQDQLTRKGSGYVGDRAPDFLLANDRSSQLLYFRTGPDGQVYTIDWYDIQQCHTAQVVDHDRSNGRVFRIAYNDAPIVQVDLHSWTNEQLVDALDDENQWYVRTARRLLQERQIAKSDAAAVKTIRELTSAKDVRHRLSGLWTLAACDALTVADCEKALSDADPYVRGWSIQLASQNLDAKALGSLRGSWVKLAAEDPSPIVRLYLASVAQEVPIEAAAAIVKPLLKHTADADDHNLPLLYWYAVSRIAESNPALAVATASGSQIPLVEEFLARQLSSGDAGPAIDALIAHLNQRDIDGNYAGLLEEMLVGLATRKSPTMPAGWQTLRDRLYASSNEEVKQLAFEVAARFRDPQAIAQLRSLAADTSASVPQRQSVLRTLRDIRDEQGMSIAMQTLGEPEMRQESVATLAGGMDEKLAGQLIDVAREWPVEDRRGVLYAMMRRPATAEVMWKAIQERRVASHEISADMIEQLRRLKGFASMPSVESHWNSTQATAEELQKQMAGMKAMLVKEESSGDLGNGRQIFAKTCGQCHKLFGEGGAIGPELTGSNRRDLDYLLSNILSPSAVMAVEYQPWVVQTEDGQVVAGLLKGDSDSSIELQTPTELVTIYREEIAGMKRSDKSMMPENLLNNLSQKEIIDLVGYLRSSGPQQTTAQR